MLRQGGWLGIRARFYRQLNQVLNKHGFSEFVEGLCTKHYAEKLGRPSLPPVTCSRLLLIGYFEDIGRAKH